MSDTNDIYVNHQLLADTHMLWARELLGILGPHGLSQPASRSVKYHNMCHISRINGCIKHLQFGHLFGIVHD